MKKGFLIFLMSLLFLPIVWGAPANSTSCGDVSSDLTLTADVNSTGTCFNILAADIVLDCDGHKINYSTAGTVGYGINDTGFSNVTIKNCNIYEGNVSGDNKYGVYFNKANNGIIEDSHITTISTSLANCIYLAYSNSSIISNNTIAAGPSGHGIYLYPYSNLNTISNNTITAGSTGHGIFLQTSSNGNNIMNNTITMNGTLGNGIYLFSSSNGNNITNNIVNLSGAQAYGIYLRVASDSNIVTSNIIYANSGMSSDAINSEDSDLNVLANNIISTGPYASSYGILLASSNSHNITNNTITAIGSDGKGIYLVSSENNTFLNNNISSTQSYEIYDEGGYINYLIYNNSYGEIRWTDTSDGGFLKNLTIDGPIALGTNLFIGDDVAALNTSALSGKINSSANITLRGLGLGSVDSIKRLESYSTSNSEIINNGVNCVGTSCSILSYGGGVLVFNTSYFSSFAGNESAPIPEFSDYAVLLILVVVGGGFLFMRKRR